MRTNILLSKLNFDANWAKSAIGEELVGHKKVVVMPFSYWDSEVYDLDSWKNFIDQIESILKKSMHHFHHMDMSEINLNILIFFAIRQMI